MGRWLPSHLLTAPVWLLSVRPAVLHICAWQCCRTSQAFACHVCMLCGPAYSPLPHPTNCLTFTPKAHAISPPPPPPPPPILAQAKGKLRSAMSFSLITLNSVVFSFFHYQQTLMLELLVGMQLARHQSEPASLQVRSQWHSTLELMRTLRF